MLLQAKELTVAFDRSKPILEGVNLSLNNGEVVVIIGENGAGKSTLIKTLAGLIKYAQGIIQIQGKNINDWKRSELSKTVSYVASKENPSALLTVYEFVAFGRYPFTNWLMKFTVEDHEAIDHALESCKIDALKNKRMDELSDGERQKVFLAKSLAQDATILFFDEPTSHLDIKSSKNILNLISSLKQTNKTIVFSTHQVEKALLIADKIWLINDGKVIETNPLAFNNSERLKRIIFGE